MAEMSAGFAIILPNWEELFSPKDGFTLWCLPMGEKASDVLFKDGFVFFVV